MERKKRPQTRYQLYGELAWRSVFCVISPTPNWTAFALITPDLRSIAGVYLGVHSRDDSKLEHYTGRQPIFDLFDVEKKSSERWNAK